MDLSVIIPVYNTEQGLRACLDSVLASGYRDFEVILIDDGSTDGSQGICREYAGKDLRIRLICQENRGVSAARNRALEVSRGTWIVFVDSDDEISPDFLEMVVRKENQKQDLLIFDFFAEDPDSGREDRGWEALPIHYTGEDRIRLIGRTLRGRQLADGGRANLRSPCARAYRRSLIERHSIRFLPDVVMGEDVLFNTEYLLRTEACTYIPRSVYRYRVRSGSTTHSFIPGLWQNYYIFHHYLKDLLDRHQVFSALAQAYDADVLENMAYVLINGVFSPLNPEPYRESLRTCAQMRSDGICDQALRRNRYIGILPRRILLGFFRVRCFWVVKVICRLCYAYLNK